MIKQLFYLTLFSFSFTLVNFVYPVKNVQGQMELKPNMDNLGDLPNNSEQMFSWRCRNGNKKIAVEVKDVEDWQKILKNQGWSCQEDLTPIAGDKGKFSCTPQADIGILTFVWEQGEGSKQQMQTWFDDLTNNHNMVCYKSRTNEFWD
jgi:hypothetical protein